MKIFITCRAIKTQGDMSWLGLGLSFLFPLQHVDLVEGVFLRIKQRADPRL